MINPWPNTYQARGSIGKKLPRRIFFFSVFLYTEGELPPALKLRRGRSFWLSL